MKEKILGILMLDTQFPRILGDAGNPETYPVDVIIHVVKGVSSLDVVTDQQISMDVKQRFVNAAQSLENDGATAITSTCGFLFNEQDMISRAVKVPVMVSSLSLYRKIKSEVGFKKVAILTASEMDLCSLIRRSQDIAIDDVAIIGMEKCNAFSDAILQDRGNQSTNLRIQDIAEFIQAKLSALLSENSDIGAILLECGNLPPYISVIKSLTDLPVYSILDGVDQLLLPPTQFAAEMKGRNPLR